MADYEYPITSAGVPQSYPLDAGNAALITVIDETDNTRVLKAQRLAAGVFLLTVDASDAAVQAAVKDYVQRRALLRTEAGGIRNPEGDLRQTLTGTNVAVAD